MGERSDDDFQHVNVCNQRTLGHFSRHFIFSFIRDPSRKMTLLILLSVQIHCMLFSRRIASLPYTIAPSS